jgi:hypothetical protein
MVMMTADVADAPTTTMAAVATVDNAHSATTVPAHAAAAAMAASAGFGCAEHCKAKRGSRDNGQKVRFTNHDTLLGDPFGIGELPIRALVGRLPQKVQRPARLARSQAPADALQIQQTRDKQGFRPAAETGPACATCA